MQDQNEQRPRGDKGAGHRREQNLGEVWQAGEAIRHDVEDLVAAVNRQRLDLERRVRERPLLALGAAFGIGFVLGGGLASRMGAWLLLTGGRLVAGQAIRYLTANIGSEISDEISDET